DQGYLLVVAKLPSGASVQRTDAVLQKVAQRVLPGEGILGSGMPAGFAGPSPALAPDSAAAYFPRTPYEERKKLGVKLDDTITETRKRTADITEAQIVTIPPPLSQGIGSAGGCRMIVQDRGGHGYAQLAKESNNLIGKANQAQGLANVFTFFDPTNPRVFADIDRAKANALGVPPDRVFEALQVYLGSA